MNVSEEWAEWHLTPRGWERGSRRLDGSEGKVITQLPADAVATYRYSNDLDVSNIDSIDGPDFTPSTASSKVWESADKQMVKSLLAKYGPAPRSLG